MKIEGMEGDWELIQEIYPKPEGNLQSITFPNQGKWLLLKLIPKETSWEFCQFVKEKAPSLSTPSDLWSLVVLLDEFLHNKLKE